MTRMSEIPADLWEEMTPAVRAFVAAILKRQAELEQRVAELEAQVGKNSRNSSKPPSTEHPHAKSKPKKSKAKRKRGAQPGHPKFERALIPTAECEEAIICKPDACRGCGHKLRGHDADPLREQVWDVQIRPVVTEYQRHRLTCDRCGTSTCGALPEGVEGRTGPVLTALLALMTSWFRSSRRKAAQFASDVCGVPCSAGHVSELETRTTAALQETYDELAAALPDEPQLKIDETPFRRGPLKTWLWTFVAGAFTVLAVRPSRKAVELAGMIGEEFSGAIHCDRAKMYFGYETLQWCWAHLKRDFQGLIDSPDRQLKRLGHDLMRPTKKLFAQYAKCRDGTITHGTLRRNLSPVRQEVEALLLRGFGTAARGMCKELYQHRDHLWTFLQHPDVEPTNNGAERSLRHGVIWRRLSFGTQSERGDRFVEVMLTIIETCRQQDRNVLHFVTHAIQTRTPISLIPPINAHAA